jgi:phosphatidylserine/phosphatidylglycerophosphate/cardiolipin synthase-like enzyme
VLNQTFPPNGGDNTTAFSKLKARGVSVVYASSGYTFTHAKTVVIDSAKVLIMTMNLTQTSAKDNREYIATDSDPADVADCEKLFAADYANQTVTVAGKLIVSPLAASPVDPRSRLKALIDSAQTSLDVEVQSLSDDTLTDAIILAHKAKVAVRVVLASGNAMSQGELDDLGKLKAAGVPVVGLLAPYIHAKALVVDNAKVFVGSQNFTPTALLQNREVGLVTDVASEVTKVRDVIAKDFAAGTKL